MSGSSLPLKEAMVLVVDVGIPSSKRAAASNAVSLLLQQKMMFTPRDEIALIFQGSSLTHNRLATGSSTQYQHIAVARPFMCPDVKTLEAFECLKEENYPGDLLDSLVVAADLIHEKTEGKRYRKKIVLVTAAHRKEKRKDDLQVIMDALKGKEISLVVVGIEFTQSGVNSGSDWEKMSEKEQNECVLYYMCEYIGNNSVVVHADEALDTLSQLRAKTVAQRPYLSCVFDIGNTVKIPIRMFLKALPQHLPSLKSRSTKVKDQLNEIAMERSFFTVSGTSKEVPKAEAVRAYRYGRSVIPLNEVDEDKLKNQTCGTKSMTLLAFVQENEVPRHYLMGSVFMVAHVAGDVPGKKTLTALIHGMSHLGRCALVRFISRNGGNPTVGVLFPVVKAEYSILYYCSLPFTEDIRSYGFRTLSDVPVTPLEQKTMDDYVSAMTADDFNLKAVHNPVIHHYYASVQARMLDASSPIPPLPENIKAKCCCWGEPNNILYKAGEISNELAPTFKSVFPVAMKAKDETADKRKKFWFAHGEVLEADGIPSGKRVKVDPMLAHGSNTTNSLSGAPVTQGTRGDTVDPSTGILPRAPATKIGTTHPVQDFEDMIGCRERDLLPTAIYEMQEIMFVLLKHSVGSDLHLKCYDCLLTLRRVCLNERQVTSFNNFMRHLKASPCAEVFWRNHVVAGGVTLINESEAPGGVPMAEAKSFPYTQVRSEEVSMFDDGVAEDEEQLFEQLE